MKTELKKGMKFTSKHFKGHVEILEILESQNVLKVKSVRRFDRYHDEDWNLEHTIIGFDRGDYCFSEELVSSVKVYDSTIGCETNGCDVMISISTLHPAFEINDYYFTKAQISDLIQALDRFR